MAMGLYFPIIYASDFWLLNSHLVLLTNQTSPENMTVTIKTGTYNKDYFGYQKQFLLSQKQNEEWGL
jgi:Cleft lip and palate transmembrane protein 1 (CLPTM1)